jgi:hypothetical protein
VEGNGVLIGLVSRLGQVPLVGEWQPSVKVIWKLVPVREGSGIFTLTAGVEASGTLPESDWQAAKAKMLPWYQNKQYDSVSLCKADLAAAMDAFLDELQLRWGDRYAPKYLFKVRDGYYNSGFQLNYFREYNEDSLIILSIVDRVTKKDVDLPFEWQGGVIFNNNSRLINIMIPGDQTIRATLPDSNLVLEFRIRSNDGLNSDIVNSFLGGLGKDILNTILEELKGQYDSLRLKDKNEVNNFEVEYKNSIQSLNSPIYSGTALIDTTGSVNYTSSSIVNSQEDLIEVDMKEISVLMQDEDHFKFTTYPDSIRKYSFDYIEASLIALYCYDLVYGQDTIPFREKFITLFLNVENFTDTYQAIVQKDRSKLKPMIQRIVLTDYENKKNQLILKYLDRIKDELFH